MRTLSFWLLLLLVGGSAPAGAEVFTVVNTSDSGPGSLRAAILQANSLPGPDTITFNLSGSPPYSIRPASPLPALAEAVTLDATTQPGYAGTPLVEVSGVNAGAGTDGLVVLSGHCVIRGLAINRFAGAGVLVETGGTNLIQANFIGTDVTGTAGAPNGDAAITLFHSPGNVIGGLAPGDRNLLAGRNKTGLFISGVNAARNQVLGNFIGTDVTGAVALSNLFNGVLISDAPANVVGGSAPAARNLISASGQSGVYLFGPNAVSNVVQGNFIGTDITGTRRLANVSDGITVFNAAGNLLGGTVPGAGNLISGNQQYGVFIDGANATQNVVQGNLVGTDVSGTLDLGNRFAGVGIGAAANRIGGTNAAARNVISGNDQAGVYLFGSGASNNLVQGNFIGTDASGARALSNSFDGISLSRASANVIGGADRGAGNVISGNAFFGIYITNTVPPGSVVQGNFIGTDASGRARLGNGQSGIGIYGAPGNLIGGTNAGAGNLISANEQLGLYLSGPTASNNVIQGNFIGTGITGSESLGNTLDGMIISEAPDNLIGGTVPGARNLVSNNGDSGIYIFGVGAVRNRVQGNFIGTDLAGVALRGNRLDGVTIFDGSSNVVGGSILGAGNLIGGNGDTGVYILGSAAEGNRVQGNFIGTRPDGATRLDNRLHGVQVDLASSFNLLGGLGLNEGNLIAFNATEGYDGVRIKPGSGNSHPVGNLIAGNSIFGHVGLGIDLGVDGLTGNDNDDGDRGANNLQNFPILTAANNTSGNTVVQGTLNSERNKSYRIDFFANPVCNASGYGEGQTWLGALNVTTDSGGDTAFTHALPPAVPAGYFITATATDTANNTSEFSACRAVAGNSVSANLLVSATATPNPAAPGSQLTGQIVVQNTGPNAAYGARLVVRLPPEVEYVSASPPPASRFGATLTFQLGTLAHNASANVALVMTALAAGRHTNSLAVTSAVPDPNPGNNSSELVITVAGATVISAIPDQVTDEDTATGPIPFTVGSGQAAPETLLVSGNSSQPLLVPAASILFGGSGSNRTVTIRPATNQFGTATITLTVTDLHGGSATTAFLLTVNPVNDRPMLSSLPDQVVLEDASVTVPFTIGDVDTPVSNLSLLGRSSHPDLVPDGRITFGGSGGNRTVTVAPATNGFGNAFITLTVADGQGGSASNLFLVTVTPVNDPPTLDEIGDMTVEQGAGLQTVPLTGITSGATNENQRLTLTASASPPELITGLAVHYTSPEAAGSLTFTPAATANGTAVVTVAVRDDGGTLNGGQDLVECVFAITVAPLPRLTIARAGQQVTISWPATAVGWQLEVTDRLFSPAWNPVAVTPVTTGDRYSVTLDLAAGDRFFRLWKP